MFVAQLTEALTVSAERSNTLVAVRYFEPTSTYLSTLDDGDATEPESGADSGDGVHLVEVWGSLHRARELQITCAEAGDQHFTFEQLDMLPPGSIWGVMASVSNPLVDDSGAVIGFSVSNDELERARQLAGCVGGLPPIAAEFSEMEADAADVDERSELGQDDDIDDEHMEEDDTM